MMYKKIFRSTFAAAVMVLLMSVVLIMGILFEYFEGQLQNELKTEASYISQGLKNDGIEYFDDFNSNTRRISLITPDGAVIFDTNADKSKLDNHLQREEVQQAIKSGSGISVRYSDSMLEKTVYYAEKLEDGNILRVSTTQYTVFTVLLGLMQPVIVVMLIALLLSIFLSSRASKSIIKPINELNLDNPAENVTYDELAPLLHKIAIQNKTIDEQLKEAGQKQEEFRLITENMNEGFLVIDKAARLLTHNTSALKLLGGNGSEQESVFMLNHSKDFIETIEKALSGESCEKIARINNKAINLIASPVYEDKKLIGAVIIIIDMTESVEREQLRREFTSNVSHELKTPLTSISGFAEIMKDGGTPEETVKDFSKSIYDEAQRLITLVSDIIKISELDENTNAFESESVNLYELAQSVAKRLQPEADKKNILIRLKGNDTYVVGVRKILDEMISNLCDNAIKYNKDNGSAEIDVHTENGFAVLSVSDTGIGIPEESKNRVFERFYRVDKSHSKAIGGTGLGLSIVKHGAIYHKAKITLDSKEGKGTSISIVFPADFRNIQF